MSQYRDPCDLIPPIVPKWLSRLTNRVFHRLLRQPVYNYADDHDTKLQAAVRRILREQCPTLSDQEIEDAIADWYRFWDMWLCLDEEEETFDDPHAA